jgi:hypothetical protein
MALLRRYPVLQVALFNLETPTKVFGDILSAGLELA